MFYLPSLRLPLVNNHGRPTPKNTQIVCNRVRAGYRTKEYKSLTQLLKVTKKRPKSVKSTVVIMALSQLHALVLLRLTSSQVPSPVSA